MKTKRILLAAIIAATSAIPAATAEHKLPAPLPEFKTPEQLAKWWQEMTEKAAAEDALPANEANSEPTTSAFFTGKPYIQETENYAFKFRQYDPELARWTSADPSGFPDGANNRVYNNNPLNGMDPDGKAWGVADFLWHFYFEGGTPVSLSEIGYLEGVKNVANTSGTGGVYRFEAQVNKTASGLSKPYNGSFSDSFSRSYDFGSVRWELGSGTLAGIFSGNMISNPFSSTSGGTYSYTGTASMFYSDTFTDVTGVIQHYYGSSTSPNAPGWLADAANLGGTAFRILDAWSQTLSGSGVYE